MRQPAPISKIGPVELQRRITAGGNVYLIHTLPEEHFRKIRLPRSVNACVYMVTFIDQVAAAVPGKEAEIVLYGSGSSSRDSRIAAEKLLLDGYSHVYVLDGGLEAWQSAGLPVEGEAVLEPIDPKTRLVLADRAYRIDTQRSSIGWTGRNPDTTHFGDVKLSSGRLAVTGGTISGTFEIDMNSIANKNLEGDDLQPVLISHLKSDDFFLVKLFPTARFEIRRAAPIPDPFLTSPNVAVHGTLALRGVTADIDFTATVTRTPENGLAAEAHFDLDRTRWRIIYGSARFFEHLGRHVVFDLITFQIRIFAD
jgi:polyisoprenoid-binding protein YceI/rhodanese-related sulfurtransferase